MSYVALYRKWRPDVFQEVKGQEHIVTTLKNQIKHERVGHAYLFCGTRGTGKTTIAKLMAKAVNCEHPVDGSPCNDCESCRAIAAGNSMNVIEIDAASNNGVDNIRQINNAVQYSPQSGKYLVYIIDEVHMLSIGAFNALLKTLEEPPAYVIFILATTEAHKIPVTILSRCQRYNFKRISMETIADRLGELLCREGIEASSDALAYVAKAADGSMRDALSILDQCIAFHLGEKLTYDMVLDTIGAVDIDVYIRLLGCIRDRDIGGAVEIIEQAVWQGKDLVQLVNEFTGFIRNVLLLGISPDMRLDVTSENKAVMTGLAGDFSDESLMAYINILQEASSKMSYMTTKRIALEVAVIKMCKPQMQEGYAALEQRMEDVESVLHDMPDGKQLVYVSKSETDVSAVPDTGSTVDMTPSTADEQSDRIVDNLRQKYREADYDEIMSIVSVWKQIKNNAMAFARHYLDKVSVTPGDMPGTLDLVIVKSQESALAMEYFDQKVNIDLLEKEIARLTERTVHIGVRKISPQEAVSARVSDWDLSKINFDIEYKY